MINVEEKWDDEEFDEDLEEEWEEEEYEEEF